MYKMKHTDSVASRISEFVSFANRFSTIRSWSLSSSHSRHSLFAIVTYCLLLINVVAGRSLYSNADAHFRENLSTDVNAINMYSNNQSSPKVCSFRLDTDTAQLTLTGRITVITKFSNDHFVMRQVIMFNKLESRFRNGGFVNTQFAVVYAENSEANTNPTTPSSIEDTAPDTDSTSDSTNFTVPDPIERIPTVYNVTVLKENRVDIDNTNRSPFEFFEPHACYVFDPCGRLTYIIYYPWSTIQRPFVKASILSTNFDHPCGKCENSSSIYTTATETVTTALLTESSTQTPSTTVSQNEQSIDPVSRTHITGPGSTSATKRRANLIRTTDESTTDDSFKIPIQIVVPSEHAHLEVQPISDPSNSTFDDPTDQVYIKFKFMVLRTGEPDFHGHLPTDQPERLTRLPPSNQTLLLATSSTETPIATNSSSGSATNTSAMLLLTDEYENLFLGLPIALPSNSSLPPPILTAYSSKLQQIHFTKDFVNLQTLSEYEYNRNPSKIISNIESVAASDEDRHEDVGDNTVYQLSEEQRHSNEHYSQILQWIQFVL